jgi:hypothetical protein
MYRAALCVLSGCPFDCRNPKHDHTLTTTKTQTLYLLFKFSQKPQERRDAFEGLVLICAKACGHLTPPWRGGYHKSFDKLRHSARVPWVRRWLHEQLKKPQMDFCQFIGRRCKFALIDEIRRATSKPKLETMQYVPSKVEDEQARLGQLGKHQRHASKKTKLTGEEWFLAAQCAVSGERASNVAYAKLLGKSEGYVRKLKASLLEKLRRAKQERVDHFFSKHRHVVPATKYRKAKRVSKIQDQVWWEAKTKK